ncbi:MAG: signal peptidase II [Deltaproteobacteria bacterium]|nr:signal peptidase II [Deltaproteobacteria bacterium]
MTDSLRRLLLIAPLTVLVDQTSKHLVMTGMRLGQSIPLLKGYLRLTYIRNPGAAFGFLSTSSEAFRVPFFLGISFLAITVVLIFYLRSAQGNTLLQVGLSLVLGGAVGNLIDRFRFHEVVDFIDLYFRQYHWPAFNVADSAISVGVTILLIDAVLTGRMEKQNPEGT